MPEHSIYDHSAFMRTMLVLTHVQKIGHLTLFIATRTERVARLLTGLPSSMPGGTICKQQQLTFTNTVRTI